MAGKKKQVRSSELGVERTLSVQSEKSESKIAVNPKIYLSLFQVNPDGRKILAEMAFRFYDRLSYTEGDSHATAFREGQRSVIQFIIQKCADAQD